MNLDRACSTCSAVFRERDQHFCRLYPPSVTVIAVPQQHPITNQVQMGMQTVAVYPPVQPQQWCLQWAPGARIQLVS